MASGNLLSQLPRDTADDYQPLVPVAFAVCAGIVVDRYWGLPLGTWLLGAMMLWLGWWLAWRRGRERLAAVMLLHAAAAVAGGWHHGRWNLFSRVDLSLFARDAREPVCIEAVATGGARFAPKPRDDAFNTLPQSESTRIDVRVTAIRDGGTWRRAAGSVTLFVVGWTPAIYSGDRLRVVGQFASIRAPQNPGGYDYAKLARADRRLCGVSCEFPECVTRMSEGSALSITRSIDKLRSRGDALLIKHIGEDRSGLAAAMFLGIREELDDDVGQAFVETGTFHLLVVSGLNVAILAFCLFGLLRVGLLSTRWALVAVAIVTILYTVVTGAQPPIVRAAVIVVVACLAHGLGREPYGLNTLAAAALIVVALNPAELFQYGTLLSFMSVAALWLGGQALWPREKYDPLELLIERAQSWPERMTRRFVTGAWRLTVAGAAIWLVVTPLVAGQFHLASPSSLLLTPILAIPVAVAMASGFGVMTLGAISSTLGDILGWWCDKSLQVVSGCVELARELPVSYIWTVGPAWWWLAGFYGSLVAWALLPRWRPPPRWCLAGLAFWVLCGVAGWWWNRPPRDQLTCEFLSVGHGCATVLELPGGKTLLYDAGHVGSSEVAARAVAGYLWSRGYSRIDAVVLSHADSDHYNGLPKLLAKFRCGAVYVSPVMFPDREGPVKELKEIIEKAGVPIKPIWSGDHLRTGSDCSITVLHPPRDGVLGSDNANSIVLEVEFEGRRILLTGDLESPGLDDVIAEAPLHCDVVMAPHHGSRFSDPPEFVRWSTPNFSVISGDLRDYSGEVARTFQSRGGKVYHTGKVGGVNVAVRKEKIAVKAFHDSPLPLTTDH